MHFGNLWIIGYLCLALGGLVFFLIMTERQRKKDLLRFADEQLIRKLLLSVDARNRLIKKGIILTGFCLSFIALIRPQGGFQWEETKRKGLDILIALDVSKSMQAEDVKPNRLERAKLALKDLVKKVQADRVGLIAFSGSAFLQCPLTVDYNGFLLTLDEVGVGTIPVGGTNIGAGIEEAIRSYKHIAFKHKILVIITDGEDHTGKAIAYAEEAKKQGITIYCIGIGTRQGELIPVEDDQGKMSFLKDETGSYVKSRLDETTLQKIALTTGGIYLKAGAQEFGLNYLYDEKFSHFEKRDYDAKMHKKYKEWFQIPLFFAFFLFLIEPFIKDRKKGSLL